MSTLSAFVALFCLAASVAVCLAWDKIIGFILPKKGYDFSRERQHYNPTITDHPSVFTKKSFLWYSGYVDFQRRRKMKTFLSLVVIAVLFSGCVTMQVGGVRYTRMFEEQNIDNLNISVKSPDGTVITAILDKMENSSNEQQALDIISAVVNAGR
jgi:hypothetical protein